MATLTKKKFIELANIRGSRCVSVFLPTHRKGMEVLNRQDELVFKNLLTEVQSEMEKRGYSQTGIREFMGPARNLLNNSNFWRNQSEGLAVFLAKNILYYFTLPIAFEPFYYLSHEFYLKPLLPLLASEPDFYLLTLNMQEVKFFKGGRENLDEILLEETLPQRLEEVVGYDYRQKFHGFRGQRSGGHAQAVFHGHGEWQEDEKDEILAFFRAIDKAVAGYLGGSTTPLLVAGLDHLVALYEKANTYPALHPEHISGNPEYVKTPELLDQALEVLASGFEKEKERKTDLFNQFNYTNRTSADLQHIIPAARGGQVDTLFLAKDFESWGVYDEQEGEVRVSEERHPADVSLTNMAATLVILNGGQVYLQERDQLPAPEWGVNALYRY